MKKRGVWSFILVLTALMVLNWPAGSAKAETYRWKSLANGNRQCYTSSGELVKNKWVEKRHLNANGYMDRNKWVARYVDGKWKSVFVRDDGLWVENFKQGWQHIGAYYYFYTSKGVMVKSKWITVPLVGKYYVNAKGRMVTGLVKMDGGYRYFSKNGLSQVGWRTINKKRYYFRSKDRLAATGLLKFGNGKVYYFNSKGVMQTGWQKISGKYYYFMNERKTGWLELDGKTYYLDTETGARATGIYAVENKLYYFDNSGVMQKGITVEYEGRKYVVTATGECNLVPDAGAPSKDMLFFLTFESGSDAYNQTGGDHGCACGAYQFDYRYSLLGFVKYAYKQDSKLCAEFKKYAGWTGSSKLKSNNNFYKAWHAIYKRNPLAFAELQDTYAKVNYYDPVERSLALKGINLGTRSDVVKGAVYSYSIQHGQTSAVNAVLACNIKASTTDQSFLKKLYTYRGREHSTYLTRYQAEYQLALKTLKASSKKK